MTESVFIDLEEEPLVWARRYCERGWRVLPLHMLINGACTCPKGQECGKSAGKHPVYGAWAAKATSDYKIAEEDFKNKKRNIGIAMGRGYVTVDVDGEDGKRSLKNWESEFGPLPPGPVQETGNHGLHFVFKTKENFKNAVRIVEGIDVRSEGGQIAACPSVHRTGNRYRWREGTFDLPVPELPEWLAAFLRGTAHADFDIEGWLADTDPAIQGENGSKVLMRVTHKLVRAGMCRTLSRFLTVVDPWNARCAPPWGDKELEHAFTNAMLKFENEATIDLPMDKNGQVICSRVDMDRIVREDPRYDGQFRYNSRTLTPYYRDKPMADSDFTRVEVEICNRYRLRQANTQWLKGSVVAVSEERGFDPVAEYLRGLKWDGEPRLAQVPARYMGCKDSALLSSFFRRWAIGAARRALEPGCQMDNVLVLHTAEQGKGKSSFFRTLSKGWHTDTAIDLANKDVYLTLHSTWIMEWGELASLKRAEQAKIKNFITSLEDNFRPPYGAANVTKKRAGVIVGSTNDPRFLDDPTGSRRFWIMPCGDFDLVGLAEVVDQLWAEAVALVKARKQHWLTEREDAARKELARAYTVEDATYKDASDILEYGPDSVSWAHLCQQLGIREHGRAREQESVVRALEACGFTQERVVIEEAGVKKRKWYWVRARDRATV